jgi:hypothetical protein
MKRLTSAKEKLKQKTNSARALRAKATKRSVAFVALAFAVIGAVIIFQSDAAPKNQTASGVSLSLSPSSQRLQVGTTVGVAVKLNTYGQDVNAVQANIAYPPSQFEFVNVDSAGTPFEIGAQAGVSNGVISIAKGTTATVNSPDALVGTVYLRAVAPGRKVALKFASGSVVVRASDNVNVLASKVGGQYTIQ